MRPWLLILYLTLLTAGCKDKDEIPVDILPQKKMQAVLWDMMRADQFLADYVLNKDPGVKKDSESIKLYQQIFAIHNISKETFQQSFVFYRSRPALLKVLMDSVSKQSIGAAAGPVRPEEISKDSTRQDSLIAPVVNDTLLRKGKKKRLSRD